MDTVEKIAGSLETVMRNDKSLGYKFLSLFVLYFPFWCREIHAKVLSLFCLFCYFVLEDGGGSEVAPSNISLIMY